MRNSILIEIGDVYLSDFDNKLLAPEFVESMEGGVRILFHDINGLNQYNESILTDSEPDDADPKNEARAKIKKELNRALHANQAVLEAIKAYAKALYSFVFKGDGHRKDRLFIFDTMLAGIEESTNSWEFEQAIADATFELGILALDRRLTFMSYAHNSIDYNFDKLKDRLISDLQQLRKTLID